jgi:hypothetical protein
VSRASTLASSTPTTTRLTAPVSSRRGTCTVPRLHTLSRGSVTGSPRRTSGCTVVSRVVVLTPSPYRVSTESLFVQHMIIVANNILASEVDEPRSRRCGRDSEDLADRVCRLRLMSGGLGDRDDDFVRRSTHPRRGEDFVRSLTRREGPRRNRGYDSTGREYESDARIYDRYPRRSRYGADEPGRARRFGSSMALVFGFWGGCSGCC